MNVQIPSEFGGLGGKAIYIGFVSLVTTWFGWTLYLLLLIAEFCCAADTEGSFMVERALQIAEACVEDMEEYTGYIHKHYKANQVQMKPKDILENIFYFRVCSYTEQIALVNHLDKFISENKDVGAILFSSSCDFNDMLSLFIFYDCRLKW